RPPRTDPLLPYPGLFRSCGAGGATDTGGVSGGAPPAAEPAGEQAAAGDSDFSCDPPADAPDSYDAPEQVIREGRDYIATITMEDGGQIVLDRKSTRLNSS